MEHPVNEEAGLADENNDLVSLMDECWKQLDPTDITSGYDTEVIANASVLLARAAHRLQELECEHDALLRGRHPTHRCKVCGALWIEFRDAWSLFSLHCGKCCDNASDFLQKIEPLPVLAADARDYSMVRDAHDRVALELDRYKHCLYRANGRLIQMGHEPEKLDYSIEGKS